MCRVKLQGLTKPSPVHACQHFYYNKKIELFNTVLKLVVIYIDNYI